MAVPIQVVTFWINAFLPWSIPGATTILQQGPYTGYSALVGPQYCLTDQRGFNNDIGAASRMHSAVSIDLSSPTPVMTQQHKCGYTVECDRESGQVKCRKQASPSRMQFALVSVDPIITIRLDGMANNPCTSAAWAFGDIEYKGTIVIDPATRRIAVNLKTSLFPAFEAYAAINDGAGSTLFRSVPSGGNRGLGIAFGATRPIRSRLEDQDGDGLFELPE